MAELGIVASGLGVASFAIQAGDSIMKLKNLWDAVKEAPADIKYLMEEIEALSLVLREIEPIHSSSERSVNYLSGTRCLELCRRSADTLESVAKDLDNETRRKKRIGGIKAVLKNESINKFRDRLRSAQMMLLLSNQTYYELVDISLCITFKSHSKSCAQIKKSSKLVEATNRANKFTRALQKERHDIQRQWAELHQRDLGDLKTSLSLPKQLQWASHDRPTSISSLNSNNTGKGLCCNDNTIPGDHDEQSNHKEWSDLEQRYRQVNKASKLQRRFRARIRIPSWLIVGRDFELSGYRVPSGWTFTFRTYNLIPLSAPIWKCIASGDIVGVQTLFKEGSASPFDINALGGTLLDYAAPGCTLPEMCRLLINEGVDPNVSRFNSILRGLRDIIFLEDEHIAIQERNFPDLARYLIDRTDQDLFEDDARFCYWGPCEVLSWTIQRHLSLGYETSEYQWDLIALSLAQKSYEPNMASLVKVALQGREISDFLRNQSYLLHFAAQNLGQYCAALSSFEGEQERRSSTVGLSENRDSAKGEGLAEWNIHNRNELLKLIRGLVGGDSLLHFPDKSGQTPLLSVVFRYFCPGHPYSCRGFSPALLMTISNGDLSNLCEAVVRFWLEQLRESGVDLVKYGEGEHSMHCMMAEEIEKEISFTWHKRRGSQLEPIYSRIRLLSFTYGDSPSDWNFWVTEAMDDSFAEFWDMIDHSQLAIPGAWCD